jgi:hypothetical protein
MVTGSGSAACGSALVGKFQRLLKALMARLRRSQAPAAVNIVCCTKGGERYVLLYDDAHRAEAQATAGRWAANPELSFNWSDAGAVYQSMRQPMCVICLKELR